MAPREHVPDLDDEYSDDGDDGHLAGAGSLLSISIRHKRPATAAIRPKTLSERVVDHWKATRTEKGQVDASDFNTGDLAGVWAHCFEFEPDQRSRGVRIVRVGRIIDGLVESDDPAFDTGRADAMRQTPEIAAMLIDWLRRLANDCFQTREPISERETFPVKDGSVDYSCTVIPVTKRQLVPISVVGLIESVERHPTSKGL